jgi:hypothetical protein
MNEDFLFEVTTTKVITSCPCVNFHHVNTNREDTSSSLNDVFSYNQLCAIQNHKSQISRKFKIPFVEKYNNFIMKK